MIWCCFSANINGVWIALNKQSSAKWLAIGWLVITRTLLDFFFYIQLTYMFDVTMHSQFLLVLPFSETKTIHWEFFKISHEAEQWRWCHHEKHKHKNNAKKSTYDVKTGLSVWMKSMCVLCIDIKRLERDITFFSRSFNIMTKPMQRNRCNLTYQNRIRKVFATNSVRQTNSENPSASCVTWICRYCGIYGIAPPKIIAVAAAAFTKWPTRKSNSSIIIQSILSVRFYVIYNFISQLIDEMDVYIFMSKCYWLLRYLLNGFYLFLSIRFCSVEDFKKNGKTQTLGSYLFVRLFCLTKLINWKTVFFCLRYLQIWLSGRYYFQLFWKLIAMTVMFLFDFSACVCYLSRERKMGFNVNLYS